MERETHHILDKKMKSNICCVFTEEVFVYYKLANFALYYSTDTKSSRNFRADNIKKLDVI